MPRTEPEHAKQMLCHPARCESSNRPFLLPFPSGPPPCSYSLGSVRFSNVKAFHSQLSMNDPKGTVPLGLQTSARTKKNTIVPKWHPRWKQMPLSQHFTSLFSHFILTGWLLRIRSSQRNKDKLPLISPSPGCKENRGGVDGRKEGGKWVILYSQTDCASSSKVGYSLRQNLMQFQNLSKESLSKLAASEHDPIQQFNKVFSPAVPLG